MSSGLKGWRKKETSTRKKNLQNAVAKRDGRRYDRARDKEVIPLKKLLALFLSLVFLLCACTHAVPEEKSLPNEEKLTAQGAVEAILDACGLAMEDLERTDQVLGEEGLSTYLENFYGLESDSWEECVLCRAGGAQALEIAVIRFKTNSAAQAALEGLGNYLTDREGDFTGYAPDQAALVAASLTARLGRFAALLICDDPQTAQAAFEDYLGGSATTSGPVSDPQGTITAPKGSESDPKGPETDPKSPEHDPNPLPNPGPEPVTYPGRAAYTQPGEEDMTLYDTSSILAAWASGEDGELGEKDRTILTLATQVLEKLVKGEMTDYEKERAVYQWMVRHVAYDQDHYDHLAGVSPDSYSPYNPLSQGKGVCLGFASTFQLLMDMADVECITVVGAAYHSREDHAWNMVWLNGEWYCVDATWDAGLPEYAWRFFNVTSDYMARTDHQWDYDAVPEAAAQGDGSRRVDSAAAKLVLSLPPALLGLEGEDMRDYQVFVRDGKLSLGGQDGTMLMVYRVDREGNTPLVYLFLAQESRVLYRVDETTGAIEPLELPEP